MMEGCSVKLTKDLVLEQVANDKGNIRVKPERI